MIKLLIVDDNKVLRDQMASYFRRSDYEVHTAEDAEQAQSMLRKKGPFDATILDNKMPGMNGIDLLPLIADETHTYIYTTQFESLTQRAMKNGAKGVFQKPTERLPKMKETIESNL